MKRHNGHKHTIQGHLFTVFFFFVFFLSWLLTSKKFANKIYGDEDFRISSLLLALSSIESKHCEIKIRENGKEKMNGMFHNTRCLLIILGRVLLR